MKDNNQPTLLNLGCGSNYHPEWKNFDLVPSSPEVMPADLEQGIPCPADSADAIYHSHVLEHLPLCQANEFLRDCFRVLKPGAILRIAVPDLEQIAAEYLQTIEQAWQDPSPVNLANHHWMQLELLDQILRRQSGGEMGKFMTDPHIPNAEFIRQRLGNEIHHAEQPKSDSSLGAHWWQTIGEKIRRKLLRMLFGKKLLKQLDEVRFRDSGEIHQWMYDRVSLRQILNDIGFENFRLCSSTESRIPDFPKYGLDARDGQTLKPDSIFVEACKPGTAQSKAA